MSAVELSWFACDLRSGRIAEELRTLAPSQAISRKLGVSTTAQFDLQLAQAPRWWESATDPGRTMLVPVDTLTGQPLGAWIILTRAGGAGPTVQLGGATAEAYLDRRYTGSYGGVQQDQAVIMTGVSSALAVDAPPFVFDAPNTGTLMDYSVQDGDDKTILSSLQEIMGMTAAAEWTVDVEWADAAQTRFRLMFRVRPKIGVQSTTPEAVMDLPGCISDYTLTESYEDGKGATSVLAWGEGEGAARLHSSEHVAIDQIAAGWCRWIYRYTPATGLTDPTQLDSHAAEALTQMRTGSRVWTVEAVASQAPRLGRDWALGDSVRVAIDHSPRHPNGAETVSRAYSWELDAAGDRVRPILVED
jgi:hypothetical protein